LETPSPGLPQWQAFLLNDTIGGVQEQDEKPGDDRSGAKKKARGAFSGCEELESL